MCVVFDLLSSVHSKPLFDVGIFSPISLSLKAKLGAKNTLVTLNDFSNFANNIEEF